MSSTNHVAVVGVDGSEGGRRALCWAAADADLRGGAVKAVMAWRSECTGHHAPGEADAHRQAATVLARELAALPAGQRSRTAIAGELVEGRPADALTAVARTADLLVLGSHGHGQLWHAVLGSVSRECVRRASCPVVVMPMSQSAPDGPAPVVRAARESVSA